MNNNALDRTMNHRGRTVLADAQVWRWLAAQFDR